MHKVPVAEAINMSAVPSVRVGFELDAEIADMDGGLVEIGAVSEATKGTPFGLEMDNTGGDYQFGT